MCCEGSLSGNDMIVSCPVPRSWTLHITLLSRKLKSLQLSAVASPSVVHPLPIEATLATTRTLVRSTVDQVHQYFLTVFLAHTRTQRQLLSCLRNPNLMSSFDLPIAVDLHIDGKATNDQMLKST